MDAIDFVRNYIRMCAVVDDCGECPCYKTSFCTVPASERTQEIAKDVVQRVEEWAAAHPVKTRQSELLKMFPTAELDDTNILKISPCIIDANIKDNGGKSCHFDSCYDCRRNFWLREVE